MDHLAPLTLPGLSSAGWFYYTDFCLALTLWSTVTPRLFWSVFLPLFAHLDLYLLGCFLENMPLYRIHCLLRSVAEVAMHGPGSLSRAP